MPKRLSVQALCCTAFIVAATLAARASAHHSFAMYDQSQRITLSGTVQDWQWTNPHSELFLLVAAKDGVPYDTPQIWRVEGESPEVLRSEYQLTRSSIKVGDQLTVVAQPLRDGSNGGHIVSLALPDGSTHVRTPRQ